MVEKVYKSYITVCHLIFLIIKIFVIVDVGHIGIITYYSVQIPSCFVDIFQYERIEFF